MRNDINTPTNFFEFNGLYYAIDMEKLMEFVSSSTANEKDNSTTITQLFADTSDEDEDYMPVKKSKDKQMGNVLKAVSKEITENKANVNPIFNNLRYDIAKTLLSTLINPYYNADGTFVIPKEDDDLFLGQRIAFNTLLNSGIIYEIKM